MAESGDPSLRKRLQQDCEAATGGANSIRAAILRLVVAAVRDRDLVEREHGADPVADSEIAEILCRMLRQRQESIERYLREGNAPLAAEEEAEYRILASYLPEQQVAACSDGMPKRSLP